MKNFGQYEVWSVRVWAGAGFAVGLAILLMGVLFASPSGSFFLAPVVFAGSAEFAARGHNKSLGRT
ncbi:hypothetical protein [Aeromicrobium sp. Root472D3]|uniref:hypothetical protein n=1 Tax=Aeromicrobium sp. Root472D3 TaxID=1736540 RepID=UPI000A719D52|nr:hypothetical protein [Aeromicrobium sp. Root472D3]